MENKSNSLNRIKRHQREKVLRFSIRKYSFGAASVAVAALMFLGTHAVSADAVDAKNQPTIGAPNPNEEKSPLIEPAPTAKNEEIKETEKVEVAKETEEREKPSENKETVEANSLNNGTSTSAIIATKDASADKVTEKQRLDKSQLQASITKVQELLAKVNKEKAPASTLAAIQADLERANSVLNNDSLELTQAEVDAAAKKLNEKVFVLSSMPKVVAPKTGSHETLETPKTETEIKHSLETVKEDLQKYVKKSEITTDKPNVTAAEEILENISKQLENTTLTSKELTTLLEQAKTVRNTLVNEELRANSGARDSRNGQSMGEGVNFRANGVPVEGALYNVKEYISEPAGGGSTVEGNRPRTIEKVFMKAKYSTEGNQKFITYDVYFHNDGNALGGHFVGDAFWFYPPRDLLYDVGSNYPVGVVSDAYYERYEKKAGTTGTLSHNQDNFTQVGERYTVPLRAGQNQDYGSQRLWPGAGGIFEFGGGPTRPDQRQQMLKKLENNPDLNRIIRLNNDPNGPYPRGSYSHLLTISKQQNFAYKYHVKMRLKDDVTAEQAKKAGAMAVSAKAGSGTTAYEAYVYAATGTSLLAPPTINTLTKYDGTLVSTDRVISGTGVAGATITLTLQDGTTRSIPVNNGGSWSYTLKQNEKLTQNTKPDATIKDHNAISVTQTKNGEESSATAVNVQLAKAISIDTPLQAGREITVKAAHDTGRFYVQVYNNKNDRQAAYQYGVKQEGGRWVLEEGSDKADLIVANGDNVSEKKFTLRIKDANKKTNFPFKITANSVVKVRSHYVNKDNNPANPGNDADQGWITASPATNTNPRITVNEPITRNYTADGSLTLDGLKRLVTVADTEDDANKTVGRTANENLSVTIRQGNKVVDLANNGYLKKGEYTLTYSTTDAAGAPATTNHTITVNYAAVAKPTINLLKGETLTEDEKRSLLQLQDGTSKIDVPSNARVEVELDTSSASNEKTATATVVFADNTRTAPIPVNYKVFNTFETVTKVYDFAGVGRNDNLLSYYLNPGNLPPGMSWVIKKANETEFKDANTKLIGMLKGDGVGTTAYNFGAKYQKGRFTDSPSEAEKLSHTPTFTHEVFDVIAYNDPRTQKNRVEVNNGEKLSATQAAYAVVKTPTSQALPTGTTYEWVKSATDPTALTDTEKNVTEFGEITRYVKVTLPKVSEDGPNANRVQPYKIIPVTLKVNETVKPTVQMDGRRLTTNAEDNKFVIFRGATFNPTFTVNDNSGKISTMEVSGLPSGTNFIKNTETANGDVQLSGNVTATANATLGTNNVGSVKVTDARGNTETYKFKYVVVDVEVKNTPETVDKGTKLFVPNNTRESKDSHNYVKVVATPNTDGSDVYYPGGMNFKWSKNNAEITNETVFDTPGTTTYNAVVKFPNAKSNKNNVDIDGDGRNENVTIYAPDKIERTVTFKVKPTAPIVTAKDNGDVEITPTNQPNVDKVSVTFTPQEGTNPAEVTYTAKKNASGVWEFGSGAPLTVDPTTGVFKLKDRKVKDGTTVTAKALTTDGTGGIQSTPATGIAGNGDAVLPEIEFKNTETDAQGNRVVYITPTEDTNLDVATITDNSNKLLEAVFFDQGTTLTDLGNYGLTYNKVIRNGDTITTAPLTFTVRGTLNKIKSGSTLWADDEVIVTRYASAMDAAENNIKDKSGSRDNVASNPYRVVFKTLTQATKYTPTVSKSKIERDITQANTTITATEFNKIKDTLTFSSTRGEVKVNKNTSGLTFAMKNSTVQTKQDGTLYITATVTYPDGSREDIEVPLDTTNANKAKPTLTIPEVSVKAAKAKNEQGSVPATEYNRVLNNVTVPQGQPQPTAKEVKNNGRISVVDGKNVVTVGLTFSDNTTKDVTVPVLEVKPIDITTAFNEKDNTVTVKPNTTVENGDKLHVTIRGVGMQLTKTATGYTNSRNDRNITVNSDGSITINLLGNETFQAGDRVVTRHESNKNGKVDSYETEAFAGLKPVEKVPAINLIALTNKEKEDVKAAVKKANPSVNTAELEVAANGDVIYRHKGAGVGTSDPTPVITLSQTVRERNDAEKIDPTIATLTRYVKETKHTDEQIKNAITGEHIANKVITGEIPTNGGTVVVKVTYTDGSSEDVKVPVIVTPELTPVKNLSNLTNNEKESVKDKIQALNPTATNIVVKNNGETTLTIPDVTTAPLTPAQTVKEADSNRIQPPAVTPVKNTGALTPEEKGKVVEAVKKVNPKATKVEVGEDGSTTVTFEDGTTAPLTPAQTVKEADSNRIQPPAVTPVKNTGALTPEEKGKVVEAVKKVNPKATKVEVGEDGSTTVTFEDGTTAPLTPAQTVKEADSNRIQPPAVTPVKNTGALTPEEKGKVVEAVKKVNPKATKVEVGEDGSTTVTFEDGTTAPLTPAQTVKEADSNRIQPPAVTPVKNTGALTPEEKGKVVEAVKKVNPKATKVEVGEDGSTTVTFEDGTTAPLTPAQTVKEADSNRIQPPAVTPVKNTGALTPEEKGKVVEAVKKVNPKATKVEVGEDGSTTVTFEDGTTAPLTPAQTVKEADSNRIQPPAVTPVKNTGALTPEEKGKVVEAIKKVNPKATKVEVGEDGSTTVTFEDGTTAPLTPAQTVKEADSNRIQPPAVTPVKNTGALTPEEKGKVVEAVKKVNPKATKVEVGEDGSTTVTFEDGTTAPLTPAQTVKEADSNRIQPPAVTPVKNTGALTPEEKGKVVEAVKKVNPKATKVEVGEDGSTTVTFEDGTTAPLTPAQTVKEADSNRIQPPAVTPVKNTGALTPEEKGKVVEAVKKVNPKATKVEVGEDGSTTVTFEDGTTAPLTPAQTVKEADSNRIQPPAVTPVKNTGALTPEEKGKVVEAVKKVNPKATKVEVGEDGSTTVTFEDGTTAPLTPAQTVKEADSNRIQPPAVTPVKNTGALTPEEKGKVVEAVKKVNPKATKVEVGEDGSTTVTFEDGTTAPLTPAQTVKEADSNRIQPPAVTPVKNTGALTPEEKGKVVEAVKKVNPKATKVEVGEDGSTTVTFEDGTTAPLTPAQTVKEADSNRIQPPAVTPVKNTGALTPEEKGKVVEAVKKVNPKATKVEVGEDGSTTVTFEDGTTAPLTPAQTVKEADSNRIQPPAVTPVKNTGALTPEEKGKVVEAVKKVNPKATKVEVGEDGSTTVTFEDGTTAPLTPAQTVKEADSNRIQPPAVTPVKNTGALTPEEKGKVVEAVKKVNPKATKVEVGEDGSTTVTFEDGTTAPLTPAQTVKEADSNRIQPPAVTPVKNTGALTPEEKGKVVEAVKKVNPKATKVEVGEDGSTTVTFEDGTTAPLTPAQTVKEADSNRIQPPAVTPVKNTGALTPEEKGKVVEAVKKVNPKATKVEVGEDGSTTVTFEDGTTAPLTPAQTVKEADSNRIQPPAVTPVKNTGALTPEEKGKVVEAVKKVNPKATKVEVGEDGSTTVTFEDGTTAPLTPAQTVKEADSNRIQPPAVTPVKNTGALTPEEKGKVVEAVKKVNPKATKVEVGEDGSTTVTFEDGTTAPLTPAQTVKEADSNRIQPPAVTPVKNTGALTPEEKGKVVEAVKKVNPKATKVEVGEDGSTTVTFEDGTTAPLTPAQTVKEADSNRIQPPAVTPVKNTGALTPEEKGKVVEAVKKVNPKATKVEVGEDGSTTVTFEDGTTAPLTPAQTVKEADSNRIQPPAVTPVKNTGALTPEEKGKVVEAVKKVNPKATKVEVGEDGSTTVTFEDGTTAPLTPAQTVKEADSNRIQPPAVTPVKNTGALTPEEKGKVVEAVKKVNPKATKVEVGEDGSTTVTFEDGTTAPLTPAQTVKEADSNRIQPPAVTPVKNTGALTPEEKGKVVEAVKKVNPKATKVEVGEDGSTTVTFEDGTTAPLTPAQTVKEADSNRIQPPAVTPVKNTGALTPEEKGKVVEAIKKVNPKATKVEVGEDGSTTVTFEDGTTAPLTPAQTVKEADSNRIQPPAVTPVKNTGALTPEEKGKVVEAVKKVNPKATKVEVGEDGSTTVTFEDGTTAPLTPAQTVKEADSNRIQPPAVTPVKNTGALTPEEKGKVVEAVKKVNPKATKVEVGEDGSTTVTFEDGTTAPLTPAQTVKEADSNRIQPPAVTPVKNTGALTPEEKGKVVEAVKKVNPKATKVEVGEDGSTTVTFEDGTTAPLTPAQTVKEADSNRIQPPAVTPVKNTGALTPEEKGKVVEAVKKVNPKATKVEVGEDGSTTVTFEDGTTAPLTPAQTVKEADSNRIQPPAVTPVKNTGALTPEEKGKVVEAVKKVNPKATKVEVGEDGSTTVTFEDGTTAPLTPAQTVKEADSNRIQPPAVTPVKNTGALTPEEKGKVVEAVKKVNPKATKVEVGEDGSTTVTFEDGTTAPLTPAQTVKEADSNRIQPPAVTPVKNTGALTPEEKGKVVEAVKKVNPKATKVEVGEDGSTTVTFEDGTTAPLTPAQTVKEADSNRIQPPAVTPVKNTGALTPEEKGKVVEAVKKVNPKATKVEVGEDGSTTVTFEDGTTAPLTPAQTVKEADSNRIQPPAVTPVKNTGALTPEEKGKVVEAVKKVNPKATKVEVGEDGSTTVTFEDGTTAPLTPAQTVKEADSNRIQPPAVTPVKNTGALTPEEKGKVVEAVKKVNPKATKVEVGEDGSTTVTFEDGTTAPLTPAQTVKEADSNRIQPPAVTPVKNTGALTPEEKGKVVEAVKKVNPKATKVEVGEDGSTTVTFEDGTTAPLTPAQTVKEADSNRIQPPAVTPVKNTGALTPEEKGKVVEAVKKVNPKATKVEVGEDGSTTVTFEDGTTAPLTPAQTVKEADSNRIQPPAVTPVKNTGALTPEEKGKVVEAVKKVNPKATKVEVGEDGSTTVTFEDGTTAPLTPAQTVKEADSNRIQPPAVTPVKNTGALTPEEKGKVVEAVKKVNPKATKVEVGEDGSTTVTFEDGTTAPLTPAQTVKEADSNRIQPPAVTPVKNTGALTPEEKGKVVEAVKKVNPKATKVEVGEDGSTTVTFEDGTTAPLTPAQTVKEADSNRIQPPAVTPVKNTGALTPEEKGKVVEAVKKVNPKATKVEVGEDGSTTVTFEDGTTAPLTPDKTVVEDFEPVKPTEKVPVKDKAHLTPEEKKQVADKVKDKNPGKEVTVGDDGTATVTDPTTGISHTIPGTDLVNQDFEPVKPDEKVPVKDKAHLTPEEKKQVANKVKDKNPGKEVTVGDDGTATVTDPTTGISHTIPGTDLVNQDFEPVKPDEKVPVKDKAHLTPEEKKQVANKVKDKNPGKEVTVGDDGTATVTDPTTGISHTIPGTDLVNQDFEPVKPDEKVPVKDKAHLTPEEKKQVEDKVKAKNPGKTVTVGEDGTATVTDPSTKISHPIAGKDLVIEDFTPVKPDEKVVVQDKSHLTPEEKKQVEDKVKAKNPGKTVTVGEDGTATVTDPSTKISHPIAGKDLVNEGFGVNGIPEVTPSQPEYTDPVGTSSTDGNGNLIDPPTVELPEFNGGVNGELPDPVEIPKVKLIITKWIDEQGNELKPADAKAPAVLGEANEAFEHGEIEGYVFVRTDVNEEGDVVTHVFRKVTPTKPEGNGEQQGGDNTPQPTPEVPTDNTERKPETEKPTVPDTKQAEQSTQTVDAQVAPSQNQAVLPNTGTKADRATGALGALSLLGAFGLLFAKKKKDDEEETRNN